LVFEVFFSSDTLLVYYTGVLQFSYKNSEISLVNKSPKTETINYLKSSTMKNRAKARLFKILSNLGANVESPLIQMNKKIDCIAFSQRENQVLKHCRGYETISISAS